MVGEGAAGKEEVEEVDAVLISSVDDRDGERASEGEAAVGEAGEDIGGGGGEADFRGAAAFEPFLGVADLDDTGSSGGGTDTEFGSEGEGGGAEGAATGSGSAGGGGTATKAAGEAGGVA